MEGRKVKQGKVPQEEEEDAEEHGEEGEVKPPTREEAFQRQGSISDHTFLKFFFYLQIPFLLVMVLFVMTVSKQTPGSVMD